MAEYLKQEFDKSYLIATPNTLDAALRNAIDAFPLDQTKKLVGKIINAKPGDAAFMLFAGLPIANDEEVDVLDDQGIEMRKKYLSAALNDPSLMK